MNDDFTKELWEIASSSPELQQALLRAGDGYSIPTGDITTEVFNPDRFPNFPEQEQRELIAQIIKDAMKLRVSDLSKMIAELRCALIAKEVAGETLKPVERTLRDIDVNKLAFFALILHHKHFYVPTEEKGE